MVLGLLAIVFTAFVNAFIVLMPMFAAFLLALALIKFLTFFKVRSFALEKLLGVLLLNVGVFFAAALQMHLWELVAGQERWRWIFAAGNYLFGAFLILIVQVPMNKSPLERSWASNRFVIGSLVMLATLGVAFRVESVYQFIYSAPWKLVIFLCGDHPFGT